MVFGILDSLSARSQINSINHYSHSSLYLSTHYPKSKYQNKQAPNPFWKTLSHSRSLSRTTRIAHSNTHKPQAVKHVAHSNDKLKNSLSFQFVTIFPQTKKIQITQKENSKKNLIGLHGRLGPLVERPVLFLQWILDLQLRRVHPTRAHKVNHQVWKKKNGIRIPKTTEKENRKTMRIFSLGSVWELGTELQTLESGLGFDLARGFAAEFSEGERERCRESESPWKVF